MELPDSTVKTVLFGDDNGNIFDLNGEGLAGDGGTAAINTIRKLPLQPASYNSFLEGRVSYRRKGECDLNISLEWGDERNTTSLTVPSKGSPATGNYFGGDVYFSGDFYFNEGTAQGIPATQGFSAIGKGSSVFVTLQTETVNTFEVDYIETPDG